MVEQCRECEAYKRQNARLRGLLKVLTPAFADDDTPPAKTAEDFFRALSTRTRNVVYHIASRHDAWKFTLPDSRDHNGLLKWVVQQPMRRLREQRNFGAVMECELRDVAVEYFGKCPQAWR